MLTTKTSKSALLLGGVNGQRNPPGGGGPKRVVTRRRRTKDEDANTTHTNKKKLRLPRAFAREYPTYDELRAMHTEEENPRHIATVRGNQRGTRRRIFSSRIRLANHNNTHADDETMETLTFTAAVSRFPLLLLLLRFPPPLAIGSNYASWRSRRRCRSRRYARASPRRA